MAATGVVNAKAKPASAPVKQPTTISSPVPTSAPTDGWSGPYIGINLGYGQGTLTSTGYGHEAGYSGSGCDAYASIDGDCIVDPQQTKNSMNGGIQFGYNWLSGKAVFGVEADIQSEAIKSTSGLGYYDSTFLIDEGHTLTASVDGFATFRVRAGFLVNDSLLAYLTGGVAISHMKGSFDDGATAEEQQDFGKAALALGYAVGAGAEYKLDSNWSVKGEYLHINTSQNLEAGFNADESEYYSFKSEASEDIFRIGLNYHF